MKQTAIEWLDNQIDNELKVIDNLYGKEIMGRKIGLAFVKRILVQAKEIEKEQIQESYKDGWNAGDFGSDCWEEIYYKETFKQK